MLPFDLKFCLSLSMASRSTIAMVWLRCLWIGESRIEMQRRQFGVMALVERLQAAWHRIPVVRSLHARLERLSELSLDLRLQEKLGSCGEGVTFQHPVCFSQPEQIHLGDQVSIAAFVHI